jgi:hypothetical protein
MEENAKDLERRVMALEIFDTIELKFNLNDNLLAGVKGIIVNVHKNNRTTMYDIYVFKSNELTGEFYITDGCQQVHEQFLNKISVEEEIFVNARKQFMLFWSRKRRKEQDLDKKSEITFLRLENKYGLSRNILESIWKDMTNFKNQKP